MKPVRATHYAQRRWILSIAVSLAIVCCAALPAQDAATAAADRQAMLQQLGIQELRPGVSQKTANYDESRANPDPRLPDPLLLLNGRRVRNAADWYEHRRPELLELFSREVLGRVPAGAPRVTWKILEQAPTTEAGIPVLRKHLAGQVDNSAYPALTVAIDLLVVTPAQARRPVPLVMEVAFSPATMATIARYFPEMAPGGKGNEGPRWQEQVLSRGWGYAVLQPTSYQEDSPLGLRRGLIGLTSHGQPRRPDDWGALRAWAWGASRAMDYFESDPAIDARHVAIEGHSRFGKTALVAMATDPRFAAAYISSAGTGGDKLYRHIYGEQLENLAGAGSWHWMAGNFLRYAGPKTVADLPVDAHELIALCAPRPVFIGVGSAGAGDAWADPTGEFLAAVAAGPVYKLLGAHDLGTSTMPTPETGLTHGELAFRQHRFGHTPGPNWPVFLDFAARYLEPQP